MATTPHKWAHDAACALMAPHYPNDPPSGTIIRAASMIITNFHDLADHYKTIDELKARIAAREATGGAG